MAETTNYKFQKPDKGILNWHQPLNNNFDAIDAQIKINEDAISVNAEAITAIETDVDQAKTDIINLSNAISSSQIDPIEVSNEISDLAGDGWIFTGGIGGFDLDNNGSIDANYTVRGNKELIDSHIANITNPHNVTLSQLGGSPSNHQHNKLVSPNSAINPVISTDNNGDVTIVGKIIVGGGQINGINISNLLSLTNNSIVNTLHRHSELVASDGSPDPALSVDASGRVGIGTTSPVEFLDVIGAVKIGNTTNTNTGTLRWTGSDFEGRIPSGWVSLTGVGIGGVPTSRTLTIQGTGAIDVSPATAQDLSANRSWTVTHVDTSSQASVDNSGATVIQDITLDDYGHVTALGSVALTLSTLGVTASSTEINQALSGIGVSVTAANLTSLTDDSIVNTLHRHSELVASDGSPDPALSIDANGNVGINIVSPDTKLHLFDSSPILKIESASSDFASGGVDFYKTSDTPASGDQLGVLNFYGTKDDLTQDLFASIIGISEDIVDGQLAGSLSFNVKINDVNTELLRLDGLQGDLYGPYGYGPGPGRASIVLNPSQADADLIYRSIFDQNTFFIDAVSGNVGIGTTTPDTELHVVGQIKQSVTSADVSNPPTDAELDALFTSPATVGDGWTVYIKDSNSDNFYRVVAMGTQWYTFTAVLAT